MNTQSHQILTGPEQVRHHKFTYAMDAETAAAMKRLFEITKDGCCKYAYELFEVAHFGGVVSQGAIALFGPDNIVRSNGSIPSGVKEAIKKAVIEGYLEMRTNMNRSLKPELVLH